MPSLIVPAVAPGTLRRMGDQPTLTVDELALRPWRHDDADAVVAAFTDPDIQQWHARKVEPDEVAAWIDQGRQVWEEESAAVWAVVAGDEVLGRTSLRGFDFTNGTAEFAYWVVPAGRGRNIATRAAIAVTDWAFALGMHRLEIRHSVANPRSCRVAEKAGFPAEATLRSAVLHPDGWHDMHVHARINA